MKAGAVLVAGPLLAQSMNLTPNLTRYPRHRANSRAFHWHHDHFLAGGVELEPHSDPVDRETELQKMRANIRELIFQDKKFSVEIRQASTVIVVEPSTTKTRVDDKKPDNRKEFCYDIVLDSEDENSLCQQWQHEAEQHKKLVLEKIKRRILNGGDRLWENFEQVPNGVGGKYCEDLKSSLCWDAQQSALRQIADKYAKRDGYLCSLAQLEGKREAIQDSVNERTSGSFGLEYANIPADYDFSKYWTETRGMQERVPIDIPVEYDFIKDSASRDEVRDAEDARSLQVEDDSRFGRPTFGVQIPNFPTRCLQQVPGFQHQQFVDESEHNALGRTIISSVAPRVNNINGKRVKAAVVLASRVPWLTRPQ